MRRDEFLGKVKHASGLTSLHQADTAVRAVISVLKAELPDRQAEMIASALPEDLRLGWEMVEAYPSDILEKEDMFYDGAETAGGQEVPTITQG
ncbi:MAG: DUF2267 domain-containing protein [Actinomycetota bacterium]|nr:DUF2267 domain-containing protein [Actinomycetota bacterium]